MREDVYVRDPLNEQASVLVDAQTDIKTAIKQGVLSGAPLSIVKERVLKIIDKAVARIRSPTLQEDAHKSLMRFADGAYGRFIAGLVTIPAAVLPAVITLMRGITESENTERLYYPRNEEENRAAGILKLSPTAPVEFRTYRKGIPLEEFQKTYIDRIDRALKELAEEKALDPNDFTGRNSLRNLAEMQVRYERHQEEITGFKERGTRLVVCSVHADCSDRCARWQGRVYSLDGTYGVTDDGREFQPLENATDIYYTTKAGRTYKNGLLGFNCRHRLVEYKSGMGIPKVSAEEQKREYAVTLKQREMERAVLSARERALSVKGVNIRDYTQWKDIARRRYAEYKTFSKEHGRAYYPDRVKIL